MFNQTNQALLSAVLIAISPSICVAEPPNLLLSQGQLTAFMMGGLYVFLVLAALVLMVPLMFFLSHLSKVLKSCDQHASMSSDLVWLNLIPIVNFVWMTYTVLKVGESVQQTFKAHGAQDPAQGAKVIGLGFSISFAVAHFVAPVILISLVFWIAYWVNISGCHRRISALQAPAA